jgi:hypothetical protein
VVYPVNDVAVLLVLCCDGEQVFHCPCFGIERPRYKLRVHFLFLMCDVNANSTFLFFFNSKLPT